MFHNPFVVPPRLTPFIVPPGLNPFTVPPGLDGTYRGTCVICGRGTDTAIAFRGEAEWVIAGGIKLGLPEPQASRMLELATGCDPGNVPVGVITVPYRICAECAAKASPHAPKPGLTSGDMPCYTQPGAAS